MDVCVYSVPVPVPSTRPASSGLFGWMHCFRNVFLSARDVCGGWAVTVPGEGLRVQARVAQWVWATCSSTVHPTFSWTSLHVSDSWVSCCVAGREGVEVLGVCQWRPARRGPRRGRRRSPGPAGRSTSAARRSGVGESAPTRDPGMLAPAQAQPCHLHPSAFLNPVSERSRAGPPKALGGLVTVRPRHPRPPPRPACVHEEGRVCLRGAAAVGGEAPGSASRPPLGSSVRSVFDCKVYFYFSAF